MLLDYYPNRHKYEKNQQMQDALQPSIDGISEAYGDFINQLFVHSSTWGLELFEESLGLYPSTKMSLSDRRERVMSRLRGVGVTTVEVLKNVAESFSNGLCEIREYYDEYRFEIVFTGTIGRPNNLTLFTAMIDEIKPAHLACSYIIVYRIHGALTEYTHEDLSAYTHHQLREEDI